MNVENFYIQIIPFETDDDLERYKIVRQRINDFIGELNLDIPGIANRLHGIWCNEIFKNGSKRDVSIVLSKKDIIWPIIVIATDIDRVDYDFKERFDTVQYEEMVHRYREIIDSCCERVEFFTKILFDFNLYKGTGVLKERTLNFVEEYWEKYIDEFDGNGIDPEILEALSKTVVYNVIRKRYDINKIKEGVSL